MSPQLPAANGPPEDKRLGFLRYSLADDAAAEDLRKGLLAARLAVFKDGASIRSGDRRFQALEQALVRSAWFLVLVGRYGMASWVGAETQVATGRIADPRPSSTAS
jgi:hypothetical protein